jgi:SAM-dependent methyltransferase
MRHFLSAWGMSRNKPQRFFREPLVNMGLDDPLLDGIYTPTRDIGVERIGISEQFLADAATYHHRYSHADYMVDLFERAFGALDFKPPAAARVLDIGTGSGKNSIVPMQNLLPEAVFVATDLSPDLLAILYRHAAANSFNERIMCVCVDAMRDYFVPSQFNVVTGIAILHHLVDPLMALRASYSALKKGGVAVFYEPFEGFAVITMAFKQILQRAEEGRNLDSGVAEFLRAMVIDVDARIGTDKSADRFRYMDDKWLFTRQYLERASREAGFQDIKIIPRLRGDSVIREYVVHMLATGRQLEATALPAWAWEIIDDFESGFSADMKADLGFECAIALQK